MWFFFFAQISNYDMDREKRKNKKKQNQTIESERRKEENQRTRERDRDRVPYRIMIIIGLTYQISLANEILQVLIIWCFVFIETKIISEYFCFFFFLRISKRWNFGTRKKKFITTKPNQIKSFKSIQFQYLINIKKKILCYLFQIKFQKKKISIKISNIILTNIMIDCCRLFLFFDSILWEEIRLENCPKLCRWLISKMINSSQSNQLW